MGLDLAPYKLPRRQDRVQPSGVLRTEGFVKNGVVTACLDSSCSNCVTNTIGSEICMQRQGVSELIVVNAESGQERDREVKQGNITVKRLPGDGGGKE